MPGCQFEAAERAARRSDQALVAVLLGLGQGGAEIVTGIAEIAVDPIGFAAPRQRLRLDVGRAGGLRKADRFRPVSHCPGGVAVAECRRAAAEIVERRAAPVISQRHGRRGAEDQRYGNQQRRQSVTHHFSSIFTTIPDSPADNRR